MAISRDEIKQFFEDYFANQLGAVFDENREIRAHADFDSLEMANLCMAFEDKYLVQVDLLVFRDAQYFRDVIDAIHQLADRQS